MQSGKVQAATGRTDAARASLTRALQLAPDSADPIAGLVELDLLAGRAAAARRRADEALAKRPTDPRLLHAAATASAAEGDTSRTDALLRQLLEVEPGNLSAAMSLVTPRSR